MLSDAAQAVDSTAELLSIDDLLSEPALSVELEQFASVYAALLDIESPSEPLTEELMTQAVAVLIKKVAAVKPICLIVEGMARLDNASQRAALAAPICLLIRHPLDFTTFWKFTKGILRQVPLRYEDD